MFIMVQKCSYVKTLDIFFKEPTKIHFIKEISRKIKIAPTSIRNNINGLLSENLILPKKSFPFSGYVANRENLDFIFLKRLYNLYSLKNLKEFLEKNHFPKLVAVFGSYANGEDIESSDIDLFILSKKKRFDISDFEKKLEREINLIVVDNINKLDKKLLKKIYNGVVISGGFDG